MLRTKIYIYMCIPMTYCTNNKICVLILFFLKKKKLKKYLTIQKIKII